MRLVSSCNKNTAPAISGPHVGVARGREGGGGAAAELGVMSVLCFLCYSDGLEGPGEQDKEHPGLGGNKFLILLNKESQT